MDQRQDNPHFRLKIERQLNLKEEERLASNEESKLTLKTSASQHAVNLCKPWTREEEQCLLEAVRRHGNKSWLEISNYLPSRTPFQCRYHFCKINPHKRTKSVWQDPLSDLRLLIGLRIFGGRRSWALISQHLFHRHISDLQCNERFSNVLDTQLAATREWSQSEVVALYDAVRRHGGASKWAQIARELDSGRTDNQCKRKYRVLMSGESREARRQLKEEEKLKKRESRGKEREDRA